MIEEKIWQEIQKANSILLHLHVSPDADSQGSALAMYFALISLGKKVTVIKGDSDIQESLAHISGADKIVHKNFLEIDQKDFDLFIILDSASLDRISSIQAFTFEPGLMTIVIDHHVSNPGYGKINLIDTKSPSTTFIIFNLLKRWNINFTKEIAENLLLGLYTDTGNLTYSFLNKNVFMMVAELIELVQDFSKILSTLYTISSDVLRFEGIAFKNIEIVKDVALSVVSFEELEKEKIKIDSVSASRIAGILRNLKDVSASFCLVEEDKNKIKGSLRSRNTDIYDVSKIALTLGGGGHKAAAGFYIEDSLENVKGRVLSAINQYTK